jgi:hypothetical protein
MQGAAATHRNLIGATMDDEAGPDRLIDAAGVLGLTIAPEWRVEVRGHLVVMLRLAAQVTAFPLDDAAEPAPVFVA